MEIHEGSLIILGLRDSTRTRKRQLKPVSERLLPCVKPWSSWSFPATLDSHSILYFQLFIMIAWINWKVPKSNLLAAYEFDIAFRLFSIRRPPAWLPCLYDASQKKQRGHVPSGDTAGVNTGKLEKLFVKESSLTQRLRIVFLMHIYHISCNINTKRHSTRTDSHTWHA